MSDLFASNARTSPGGYDASDIEVLEGLEPVRRRPGMYIGGTDARALHHLAAEVIDNAMDEAVAGHANRIEVELGLGNRLTVTDNGRGIPVDPHPKYPGKSALEVIMSTLHSGGKFEGKAYSTSGGLHGVGVSVVNALASETLVEVARDKILYRQSFSRGHATSTLEEVGAAPNRRGTTVSFVPDAEIFGPDAAFDPGRLYQTTLRELSPAADPVTRTYLARFSIPEAGPEVQLGMTATLTIESPSASNAARLPLSALYNAGNGPSLWTVDVDGRLALRPVTVRSFEADAVLVTAGVRDGDQVVAMGVQKLDPGQRVRVVNSLTF